MNRERKCNANRQQKFLQAEFRVSQHAHALILKERFNVEFWKLSCHLHVSLPRWFFLARYDTRHDLLLHPPGLDPPKDTWRTEQIINPLIMQHYSNLLPLTLKYSSQETVNLRFFQGRRPSFTLVHKNAQVIAYCILIFTFYGRGRKTKYSELNCRKHSWV
jgi:hypothetical protein